MKSHTHTHVSKTMYLTMTNLMERLLDRAENFANGTVKTKETSKSSFALGKTENAGNRIRLHNNSQV